MTVPREPSAELRALLREYLDEVILPQQNYSCSNCLEPLGENFSVQIQGDEIERSDALCRRCASKLDEPIWSFQMPTLPG